MSKTKPIADQLRVLIAQAERKGITRYRISQLSGVTEGQLARIVHGDGAPRLDTAARIADAIGYQLKFVSK